MANLVSPGVSVTITDESFFIPAAAATVPLIFIATEDEKVQPDAVSPAAGTYEYDVVRTVTSIRQSLELYGTPRFLEDTSGNAHHGDARNEYGLFALNQFLGIGNRAYVVRANVNLNDDLTDVRAMWDRKVQDASYVLENLANSYISEYNLANGYFPTTPGTPATSGYQIVDLATGHVGTDPFNMAPGTYDFSVVVDGGLSQTVSFAVVGTEDFNSIISTINGLMTGVVLSLDGNNDWKFTSLSTGATSTVVLTDGVTLPLFSNMNSTVHPNTILASVAGQPVGPSPYKETVTQTELISLAEEAMADIFSSFTFLNTHDDFFNDVTLTPLEVYANGFSLPSTGDYFGFNGMVADWVTNLFGSVVGDEFTPQEASNTLLAAADDFEFTREFRNQTSLGANDAARRVAISTALQATINSNEEVRSENFEFNLILCPGFPEVADEMLALVADIGDEAFVIADVPMNMAPSDVVAWAGTTNRQSSPHVAYYYPHSLASNLDGKNVLAAASGTALRTLTYSDSVSELWFAPAGTTRGLVTGVTDIGYASGQLGSPTTFVGTHLNVGQRDDLYKYFTNVNPIAYFPGRGILVWGQKTSAPDASAMDRINVSRLVKYIKRQLRKNTMTFVFRPNDQLTRDNLKAAVDSFLGDLVVKRGLYDFATYCDESNNTPDRIDRNEMYIDIAIKPVKAAEFIYIPIRIVATGASI